MYVYTMFPTFSFTSLEKRIYGKAKEDLRSDVGEKCAPHSLVPQ